MTDPSGRADGRWPGGRRPPISKHEDEHEDRGDIPVVSQQGGGGGTTSHTETRLTGATVETISDTLQRESTNVADSGFAAVPLGAVHFGGSTAGTDLGALYESAFADAVTQNDEVVAMLQDYAVNLRGARQDTEDTDTLNAVALRQIGNFDPGKD